MECEMCGQEPADPTTLRPVREVIEVPSMTGAGTEEALSTTELAVCEDCYPEASEPEMRWRLKNECPVCWAHPCRCSA